MKRITIKRFPNQLLIQLEWFVGIWTASVVVLAIVAYTLRRVILG